jgi:hypothetical protein
MSYGQKVAEIASPRACSTVSRGTDMANAQSAKGRAVVCSVRENQARGRAVRENAAGLVG